MNNIAIFNFKSHNVRTITDENNEIWFVAKDICNVLELNNVSMACNNLDDDEKLISTLLIAGQNRELLTINESGLYTLILRSNKPEAKPFRKWVTSEVLPSIRKTGKYEAEQPKMTQLEIVALMAKNLVNIEKTQINHSQKIIELENKVEQVNIKSRNGVPLNYTGIKNAWRKFGKGISKDIFLMAVDALDVPKKTYVHTTEDGFEVVSTAYKTSEIFDAIELFIDDAIQDTKKFCKSPILNDRRFKFVKEAF